jgi:hypothetical protein
MMTDNRTAIVGVPSGQMLVGEDVRLANVRLANVRLNDVVKLEPQVAHIG